MTYQTIENNDENPEIGTFSDDFSIYEADNNTDWVKQSISVLNSSKKLKDSKDNSIINT